ncbi:MAG: acyl transferase [Chlorobi bacterium]|nr:acyl transferase [Chlorobiota bacterium]
MKSDIFNIKNEKKFNDRATEIFRFQYKNNPVYAEYINNLNIKISKIKHYKQIPFLPIDFFKTHKIISKNKQHKLIFKSSGTTGMQRSKHYVAEPEIYEKSFNETFDMFYGNPEQYAVLALLPSYSEQGNSSLIYMVEKLMQKSKNPGNGFFLYNHDELFARLKKLEAQKQKTVLFGVSYALLDFFHNYKLKLENTIIIETGGMKGRKKEIIREELHKKLKKASGLPHIHSEYGMTELLSQAYAQTTDKYKTPPWMKILIRDAEDPFSYKKNGKTGGINIIDLANIYSCSFIETKDLGKINPDGSFTISGRFDDSDIRGCNLLII